MLCPTSSLQQKLLMALTQDLCSLLLKASLIVQLDGSWSDTQNTSTGRGAANILNSTICHILCAYLHNPIIKETSTTFPFLSVSFLPEGRLGDCCFSPL